MNTNDFFENCLHSLANTDDASRLDVLEKLSNQYLEDKTLHYSKTTNLLLIEIMKQETLQAEAALIKYDKHTRPGFFLPLAGAATLIAMAIIQAAPFGGKEAWLVMLVLLMLYVCARMLPSWRKRLPALREGVKGLANNALDAASSNDPLPSARAAIENKKAIVDILAEAMYRNPFFYWAEQLYTLALDNKE